MARATFLHLADLHLSRPFGFLPPQLAEERRRDQRTALAKAADLAIDRRVNLVLFSGDIFDNPEPDPTDVEAFLRETRKLSDAGLRVFAIPGNHDSQTSGSVWRQVPADSVRVFASTEWETDIVNDLGVAVAGIAFDTRRSDRRAFEGFSAVEGIPTLALVHASFERFDGQLERYHPFAEEELRASGAAYAALGHYHRFTIIGSEERPMACYAGAPEGLAFDRAETDDRFVVLGSVSDEGIVTVEPVKINRRAMRIAEIDCTSFDSEAGLFDAVRTLCKHDNLVQIRLTGSPAAGLSAVLDDLPSRFRESCLHLCIDATGLSAPAGLPADDLTIRGRFCRRMLNQIDAAAEPEAKRLLRRALELGLAALGDGSSS